MTPPVSQRRSSLVGAAVVVTDVASPLGAAMSHRLAAETTSLVLGGRPGAATDAAMANVKRIRALHRMSTDPILVETDPSTSSGAEAVVAAAVDAFGRVDGVIHAVEASRGGAHVALSPLSAMLKQGLNMMKAGGRLILAIEVSGVDCRACDNVEEAIDTVFESIVRTSARLHFDDDLCVNGILLGEAATAADQSFVLASGIRRNGAQVGSTPLSSARTAAAGVAAMLASATSCGITGQVFRIGSRPPEGIASAEATALLSKSLLMP